MNTPLQQAAQELIDRWDSPMWRYQQATTDVIAELRKALDAELEMTVEPVAHFNMAINETVGCIAYEYGKHNLKSGTPLYLHPPQQADKGPWCAGVTKEDARVHIQSDDFKHDVRLYVNGDFATKDENYLYACALARHLNSAAAMLEADVSLINEGNKVQQAKQVQSVEPVLWITDLDDPIICKTEFEAATFCEDDQRPIPVYLHPPQQVAVPSGEREQLIQQLKDEIKYYFHNDALEKMLAKAADMLAADAHQVAAPTATAEICTVMQQALDALQELWLLGDNAAAIANPAIESLKFAISQPPARPLENAEIDLLGVSGIEQFPALYNRVPWGGELMMYVRQLARAIEAHHGIGGEA